MTMVDWWVLPAHEVEHVVPYAFLGGIEAAWSIDSPLEFLTDENLFWVFYNLCAQMVQMVVAMQLQFLQSPYDIRLGINNVSSWGCY